MPPCASYLRRVPETKRAPCGTEPRQVLWLQFTRVQFGVPTLACVQLPRRRSKPGVRLPDYSIASFLVLELAMRLEAKLFGCLLALVPLTAEGVEKSGGLSKDAATKIANAFFAAEIRVEGVVTEPHLQGDYWVFPLKVGYAGNIARDPILVNRFNGKASWAGLERGKP